MTQHTACEMRLSRLGLTADVESSWHFKSDIHRVNKYNLVPHGRSLYTFINRSVRHQLHTDLDDGTSALLSDVIYANAVANEIPNKILKKIF